MDIESAKVESRYNLPSKVKVLSSWIPMLKLALQSIGVVYGDIGTSPLYVYSTTFPDGIRHKDDIIGVLSLIYYTITLLPVIKYAFIVLHANDNGNGGTFAMYSLLSRHVKVGLLPSTLAEEEVQGSSSKVQNALENSRIAKFALLFVTILATALVMGDGIITPCISVLSAVSGIKLVVPGLTEERVAWMAVGILVFLFSVQRFGTEKVSNIFSPIIGIWFLMNAGIGVYNVVRYDPTIFKAINPSYIVGYFLRNGKQAWLSLGGVVLCITGTEALFADLAHFTVRSIQVSMGFVVYPVLMLAYSGQASYLSHHPEDVSTTFFKGIPSPLYFPVFVVSILASMIGSQAIITGTFSIIEQSLSHGCFPRVTIVRTSSNHKGWVYIPEINRLLMITCVCVTLVFKTAERIGNAYGIAVMLAEIITSGFTVLVMTCVWKTHVFLVIVYIVVIMSVELAYLSSVLYKFTHGGYLPLALAFFFMFPMVAWNFVYRHKYTYHKEHKVSSDEIEEMVLSPSIYKIPGVAIFYSELDHVNVPRVFQQYVSNIPSLHSVSTLVSFKSFPNTEERNRFLFHKVYQSDNDLYIFVCLVEYGYAEFKDEHKPFEQLLVEKLKDFIREEARKTKNTSNEDEVERENDDHEIEEEDEHLMEADINALDRARETRVVHLIEESHVVARNGSGLWKKVMLDWGYNFLERTLKPRNLAFNVPQERLIKVPITYEL